MREYSIKYESYYDSQSGKWLDEKCPNAECELCSTRPKTAPIWVDVDHNLPSEEDADESGLVWVFFKDKVDLAYYHSVLFSNNWDKFISHWKPKPKIEKPNPPPHDDYCGIGLPQGECTCYRSKE